MTHLSEFGPVTGVFGVIGSIPIYDVHLRWSLHIQTTVRLQKRTLIFRASSNGRFKIQGFGAFSLHCARLNEAGVVEDGRDGGYVRCCEEPRSKWFDRAAPLYIGGDMGTERLDKLNNFYQSLGGFYITKSGAEVKRIPYFQLQLNCPMIHTWSVVRGQWRCLGEIAIAMVNGGGAPERR